MLPEVWLAKQEKYLDPGYQFLTLAKITMRYFATLFTISLILVNKPTLYFSIFNNVVEVLKLSKPSRNVNL